MNYFEYSEKSLFLGTDNGVYLDTAFLYLEELIKLKENERIKKLGNFLNEKYEGS